MSNKKGKDGEKSPDGHYEVGWGKPPRHSQFPPGVSGYKGRKKKRPEAQTAILARIRDEVVVVNGKKISKFELAVRQVFNQTIKSGKPGDLAKVLELLEKYGAIKETDYKAEAEAGAKEAFERITNVLNRTFNRDPKDIALKDEESIAEVNIVMGCAHCGPELRKRWGKPEYKALAARLSPTRFFEQVRYVREGKFNGI
jgi:hypothetical protein